MNAELGMQTNRLKIVSGGQTGVDRGALDAALQAGTPCGGWCPRGRRAEDGTIDTRYPLTEMQSKRYIDRTRQNVIDSDATLIIYFTALEGGTARTRDYCIQQDKPYVLVDGANETLPEMVARVMAFVDAYHVRTLNVAGPRASKVDRAHAVAQQLLSEVLHGTSARCSPSDLS